MQLFFFLGGYDLEMLTIRELLEKHASNRFRDKQLSWGARASAYREEIEDCLARGWIPVLVELEDDLGLDDRCRIVNHHGTSAGADAPTALHQVFDLLGLPPESWTRRMKLVAANDRGHVAAMRELGAGLEEIREIRAADRAAQGITEEQERQGEASLAGRQTLGDGRLTVVHLPHSRCAVITDRLDQDLGGPGYRNLLIFSPGEVNFYGEGRLVNALAVAFPGGWYGGNLPERGFWGHGEPLPDVLSFLRERLCDEC